MNILDTINRCFQKKVAGLLPKFTPTDGWGQRDFWDTDLGATLPYIVRRTTGAAPQTFVSLYECHAPGAALVRGVTRLSAPEDVVALDVATAKDHDIIVSQRAPHTLPATTRKKKAPRAVLKRAQPGIIQFA